MDKISIKHTNHVTLPIILRTKLISVVVRIFMALIFLFFAGFAFSIGDTSFGGIIIILLGPLISCMLLFYRVREEMVIERQGMRLKWMPLSFCGIPIIQREAFVTWGRVSRLSTKAGLLSIPVTPYAIWMPRQFTLELTIDGKPLKWRLGWHTTNTKEGIVYIAKRIRSHALGYQAQELIEKWQGT